MNTREYVDSLINNNNEELKKTKDKANTKKNIYVALGIFSLVFGVIGLTYALPVGIAAFGTGITALSGYNTAKKREKMKEDAINAENKHLEEIKTKGIKIDNASKRERHNRYNSAKANIDGKDSFIKNLSIRDNITSIISVAAGLAGFMLGGFVGIASPLIAGYKLLSNKVGNKDYQDYMNSKVKYDNVCNEYKILKHAARTRSNTRTTTTRLIPQRGKALTNNKEQVAAVDKYIEALSQMNNTPEKPKTIVKK